MWRVSNHDLEFRPDNLKLAHVRTEAVGYVWEFGSSAVGPAAFHKVLLSDEAIFMLHNTWFRLDCFFIEEALIDPEHLPRSRERLSINLIA